MKVAIIEPMSQALDASLKKEGVLIFQYTSKDGHTDCYLNAYEGNRVTRFNNPVDVLKQPVEFVVANQPAYYQLAIEHGIPVIGCSSLGASIENNPLIANWLVEHVNSKYGCDLFLPSQRVINGKEEVISELKLAGKNKNKTDKYILKYHMPSDSIYTMVVPYRNDDLINFLNWGNFADSKLPFILEHMAPDGVPISIGAWFDGNQFMLPYYVASCTTGLANRNRGNITPRMRTGYALFHENDTDLRPWKLLGCFRQILKNIGYRGLFGINVTLTTSGTLHFTRMTSFLEHPLFETLLATIKNDKLTELLKIVATSNGRASGLEPLISTDFVCGICHYALNDSPPAKIYGMRDASKFADIQPISVCYMAGKSSSKVSSSKDFWWSSPKLASLGSGCHFCVSGSGDTLQQAQNEAYLASHKIEYLGGTYRDDIGESLRTGGKELLKHGIINKNRFERIS